MADQKVYFKRGKDDWETPDEVFWPLNEEFGFTLDVCADVYNRKCERFFSKEKDGLAQIWAPEVCWLNPPYSEWQRGVEKAYVEAACGATVVALLPARTDTRAFHEWIWRESTVEIRFVKGRVKFVGAEHGAPFPSMVVVFNPHSQGGDPKPVEDNIFIRTPFLSRLDLEEMNKDLL